MQDFFETIRLQIATKLTVRHWLKSLSLSLSLTVKSWSWSLSLWLKSLLTSLLFCKSQYCCLLPLQHHVVTVVESRPRTTGGCLPISRWMS